GAAPVTLHRSLHLLKSPLLDLADTLAGYTVFRSQHFKGRRLVRQPARGEDSTLARVKRRDRTLQGLMATGGLLLLGERCFLGWCGINQPIRCIAGFILVV